MEAEFVNIFVEKQRDAINDLTARTIMLEARVALGEQKLQHAAQLMTEAESRNTYLQNTVDEKNNEVQRLNRDLTALNDAVKKATEAEAKTTAVVQELAELRRQYNQLIVERENNIQKLAKVKKQAKILAGEEEE